MRKSILFTVLAMAAPLIVPVGGADAHGRHRPRDPVVIGTSFPDDFPEIIDASTGNPVIGFGGDGRVRRTPVIFLHGNNDVPYPTECSPYGDMQDAAQYFADRGYRASELWALGYQGDQCDLLVDNTIRSSESHTVTANVPDLRAFVDAVMDYTGAKKVDIVAHSLGVTLAREWMRQDRAYRKVRHLVGIAGPEHGIINCSPDPLNYFQLPSQGGFTPDSAVCRELGSPNTEFLQRLNRREAKRPTRYLMVRNTDADFVYISGQDGVIPGVPAQDSFGQPNDFSESPWLRGACNVGVEQQGVYDPILGTGHLGIAASPEVHEMAFWFTRYNWSPCRWGGHW